MARIRSIHPGLATDEAYMSMSIQAKAAWPLLWTECDDQGVFEWKPIVLKAKLFPGETFGFDDILKEFETLRVVLRFTANDKQFGAVKNFCIYQRPKSPKIVHPLSSEAAAFVGMGNGTAVTGGAMSFTRDVTASERQARHRENKKRQKRDEDGNRNGTAVTGGASATDKPLRFPGNGEVSRQMEDGGGRKDTSSFAYAQEDAAAAPPVVVPLDARSALFRDGLASLRSLTGKPDNPARSLLGKWLKAAGDDAAAVHGAIRRAVEVRPADPVPWIERALRPRVQSSDDAWAGVDV